MQEAAGRAVGRAWALFRSWPWWVQALIALVIAGGLSQPFQANEVSPASVSSAMADTATEDASSSSTEAETPVSLRSQIADALGSSNRGKARIADFYQREGEVYVEWAIDENLTEGLTKDTARLEAFDILEAVKKSEADYKHVVVSGTYSMVDKFGNTSEDRVVLAKFPRRVIERINFSSGYFDFKAIFELDPSSFIHPAFVY